MSVKILIGDVCDRLRLLPEESAHCVVTSPPYWGMRSYGGLPGEMGMEPTMGAHIETIVRVMREVKRVLRSDGTCWVNLGDGYAHDGKWGGESGGKQDYLDDETRKRCGRHKRRSGLKEKDLLLLPSRIAIALQDEGWWVRSEVVWAKKNPMTESVKDRPANMTEKVFLLSKAERYFYDDFAVRSPPLIESLKRATRARTKPYDPPGQAAHNGSILKKRGHTRQHQGLTKEWDNMSKEAQMLGGANLRNVWLFATGSYKGEHYATFPVDLPDLCIRAGTSAKGVCGGCGAPWVRVTTITTIPQPDVSIEKSFRTKESVDPSSNWGETQRRMRLEKHVRWEASCTCREHVCPATVLDPFGGVGTTAIAAQRLKRSSILIELNLEYALLGAQRIKDDTPLFANEIEVVLPPALESGLKYPDIPFRLAEE